jgi:hypothetical protein
VGPASSAERRYRHVAHVLKRTDRRQQLLHTEAEIVERLSRMAVRCEVAFRKGEIIMLFTIAVILLIAWLLGIIGTYTIGAFVHVLLVVAIVLFVVGLLNGRRTLA